MFTLEEMTANRAAWVAALRSGKYAQCTNDLKNEKGFCCLGVLADIAGFDFQTISIHDDQVAPPLAMEFVGLHDSTGTHDVDGDTRSLAGLNDSGSTFAEIADIIENAPSDLFTEVQS